MYYSLAANEVARENALKAENIISEKRKKAEVVTNINKEDFFDN